MTLAVAGVLFAWAWIAFLLAPCLVTRRAWAIRHPTAALGTWAALFGTGLVGAGIGLTLAARSTSELSRGATTGDPLATCDSCHAAAVFGVSWLLTLAVGAGLCLAAFRAAGLVVERRRTRRAAGAACDQLPRHLVDGVPVVLLDSADYLAACTPGRRARVVVTTALRDLLSPAELSAVVAHEVAHLDRRHRALLGLAALHRACLRGSPSVEATHHSVALLVELAADDQAARRCGPGTTAAALHKVAQASSDEAMGLRARRTALACA